MHSRGQEISIYFTSADARTAARVVVYDRDGKVVADARYGAGSGTEMPESGRIYITNFTLVAAGAMTVTLFADHDNDGNVDAGEQMDVFIAGAAGEVRRDYDMVPLCSPRGDVPKIKTSAAVTVTLIATGYLTQA